MTLTRPRLKVAETVSNDQAACIHGMKAELRALKESSAALEEDGEVKAKALEEEQELVCDLRNQVRAQSHRRFVLPRIHFISYLLTCSASLFLKRQCERTLNQVADKANLLQDTQVGRMH